MSDNKWMLFLNSNDSITSLVYDVYDDEPSYSNEEKILLEGGYEKYDSLKNTLEFWENQKRDFLRDKPCVNFYYHMRLFRMEEKLNDLLLKLKKL